jgi:hypothetical protein
MMRPTCSGSKNSTGDTVPAVMPAKASMTIDKRARGDGVARLGVEVALGRQEDASRAPRCLGARVQFVCGLGGPRRGPRDLGAAAQVTPHCWRWGEGS